MLCARTRRDVTRCVHSHRDVTHSVVHVLSQGSSENTCSACGKRVYEMEKVIADKCVYHKSCFKCMHCRRYLT